MTQGDLLFAVLILIGLGTLVVPVVQVVRSGRGSMDGRGNWWEGPWDDDQH